ncbi:MAG: substrate-binding domain-containing protein [Rhodobacteraceae bacterium]|nr:substrate-binding domain-containing protein [Paracoccaceae bacterium]
MIRALVLLWLALVPQVVPAEEVFITVASTTSTQNSGLFGSILPQFTAETGIAVRVVAVGTGQAMRIARNGDADLLLVHHRASEDEFVAEGYGIERRDVMYNDFILVGPPADPANIRDAANAAEALGRIAHSGQPFISRGDDSGTHLKERELWAEAGIAPAGSWYLEAGAGMGTTLNLAVAKDAYVLTDRGTWITFGNKGGLVRLFSGDPAMFNPYGVVLLNPERFPHVKADAARAFADWLVSDTGQAAISAFRIDGFQAFCPNADAISETIRDRAACPVETD